MEDFVKKVKEAKARERRRTAANDAILEIQAFHENLRKKGMLRKPRYEIAPLDTIGRRFREGMKGKSFWMAG